MTKVFWVAGLIAAAGVAVLGSRMVGLGRATGAMAPVLGSPRQVGGVVFDDRNRNGVLDRGERAVSGRAVRVVSTEGGTERKLTTDARGSFVVDVGAVPSVVVKVSINLPAPTGSTFLVPIVLQRRVSAGQVVAIPVDGRKRTCANVRTCEGMLLPDLVSLTATPPGLNAEIQREYPGPDKPYVDITTLPGHKLLRIATISANVGKGPLLVVGTERKGEVFSATVQRVVDVEGGWNDVQSGTFAESKSNKHVHLEALESVKLVGPDGVTRSIRKVSFCLTDVFPVDDKPRQVSPVSLDLALFDCGVEQQGINVGMADYYGPALPDQYLDVTGLPPGWYRVEITTDPDNLIAESDETNNTAALDVTVP